MDPVPPNSYDEVLTPRTSAWECIWRQRLCQDDQCKMRSLGWVIIQNDRGACTRGDWTQTNRQRRKQEEMKARIGVMGPQAKGYRTARNHCFLIFPTSRSYVSPSPTSSPFSPPPIPPPLHSPTSFSSISPPPPPPLPPPRLPSPPPPLPHILLLCLPLQLPPFAGREDFFFAQTAIHLFPNSSTHLPETLGNPFPSKVEA